MSTLQGKIAIVTGSSHGIGRAIAERLGRDGAKVVVTYPGSQAKAEEAVATVPSPPQAPEGLRGEMLMMQSRGEQLVEITNLLEAGDLKTAVERVFPLSETAQALELNKAGHTHSKIVVQVVA